MARNPGAAAGATLFLAIWVAAIWFMLAVGAPAFMAIVFGLFGLLILWGVLELWLRVTRITADAGTVVVASGYLSPARERRYAMSEIAEVTTKIGMEAGETTYYDLVLVRTDGKRVTIGHGVRDKREAEWLVGLIGGALGKDEGRGSSV